MPAQGFSSGLVEQVLRAGDQLDIVGDLSIAIDSGTMLIGRCLTFRDGKPIDLMDDSKRVTAALNHAAWVGRGDNRILLKDSAGLTQVVLVSSNGVMHAEVK